MFMCYCFILLSTSFSFQCSWSLFMFHVPMSVAMCPCSVFVFHCSFSALEKYWKRRYNYKWRIPMANSYVFLAFALSQNPLPRSDTTAGMWINFQMLSFNTCWCCDNLLPKFKERVAQFWAPPPKKFWNKLLDWLWLWLGFGFGSGAVIQGM